MEGTKTLKREDAPVESTWDRDSVYPSWEAWQEDFEGTMAGLSELTEFSGKLNEGPQVLLDWFDTYSKHYYQVYKLWTFAEMAMDVDAGDEQAKGHKTQANSLYSQFIASTAFVNPELQEIGAELFTWVAEEPRLAEYKHFFDNLLRLKPNQRSAEVEEILGRMQSPAISVQQTFSELTSSDMTFSDAVACLSHQFVLFSMDASPPLTFVFTTRTPQAHSLRAQPGTKRV